MKPYRMRAECWMTDAHGRQKLYAASETIELSDAQAPSLIRAGIVGSIAAAPEAREPSDDEIIDRAVRRGRTRAANADAEA